jgi:peptide-methionine (S)-S-oxide reductase
MFEQKAIFGAGCFWCIETVFNKVQGVIKAVSGYAGGTELDANYKAVCSGMTDHVEVVEVTFDANVLSYDTLLQMLFDMHDPTQLNRQGNDVGTQYRSVIFYRDRQQQQMADAFIQKLSLSNKYLNPVVTRVEKANTFYPAEDYHQGYFEQHGHEPYCAMVVAPKVAKFINKYADYLK